MSSLAAILPPFDEAVGVLLVGGGAALIALLTCAITLHSLMIQFRWVRCTATIVDYEETHDSDTGRFFHMVFQFRDDLGTIHRVRSVSGTAWKQEPIGTTLRVAYRPDAPDQASELTLASQWGMVFWAWLFTVPVVWFALRFCWR